MIARISSGGFVGGAIGYNDDKVEEGLASVLEYANFDQCMEDGYKPADNCEIPGETLNNIDTQDVIHLIPDTAAFMMRLQLAKNSRVEKGVFSCSLNLNHDDLNNIDEKIKANGCKSEDELYRKIADKYMEGMGYGKQPYVVFKHNDIERTHIHIVSIKVDADGNKIDDRFAKRRSEQVRNDINVSFGLSTEGETKRKKLSAYDRIRIADSRNDYISRAYERINKAAQPDALVKGTSHLKHQISNVLKFVDENYHPKNLNEFNKVLAQFNVVCKPCTKGDDNQGKGYTGCQYAVLDGNGEVDSHLIKGSAFGKQYAMPALMAKFELNKGSEDIRKSDEISKKYIRETIDTFIKAPAKTDFDSLAEHLNEKGIKVNKVADLDNPTKIKGINFIDNVNGNTYNGSQLGKAYSYQNICGAIDKHNAEVDRESAKTADNVYLPKEDFIRSQQILQAYFNSHFKRKKDSSSEQTNSDNIDMEVNQPSKLVKDWIDYSVSNKEKPLEHLFSDAIEKNKKGDNPLILTDAQWHKAADYFFKDIVRKLPEMEFKEQAYQRSLLISAVKFSQHIPLVQDRVDFLHRAGVNVFYCNNDIQFNSYARKDVGLSLNELCEVTKADAEPIRPSYNLFVADKCLPDPNYDLPALSKYERDFFKDYVKNEVKPGFKMEVAAVVNLLGKSEQQQMLDSVRVPSDMWKDTNDKFRALQNSIVKDDFHYSTVKFLDNFDNYKPQFAKIANEVCGNNLMAEKMMRDYIEYLNTVVRQKEKEKSLEKIASACRFVSENVSSQAKASELLLRMGVKVEYDAYSYPHLSTLDNPRAQFTKQDLVNKDANLFGSFIPATSAEDIQNWKSGKITPLSKPALDAISHIQQDNLNADNYNPSARFTLKQYMNEEKFTQKVAPVDTQARLNKVLEYTKDKSLDAVTDGLLSHGLTIVPRYEGLKGYSFYVCQPSMHGSMVPLPKALSNALNTPHNVEVVKYRVEQVLPPGQTFSYKMGILNDIVKAAENDDDYYLYKSIKKIGDRDEKLADYLTKFANQRDKNNQVDYDFLCKFVMRYERNTVYTFTHEFTKPEDSFIKRKEVNLEKEMTSVVKTLTQASQQKPIQWPLTFKSGLINSYNFDGLKAKFNIQLNDVDKRNIEDHGILPHLVSATINGIKKDVVLSIDENKTYYLAEPAAFKPQDRHYKQLGEAGVSTLLKTGVANVKDFAFSNDDVHDTTAFLNAKTLEIWVKDDKVKFSTEESIKHKDYSQSNDQDNSQGKRKGLGV